MASPSSPLRSVPRLRPPGKRAPAGADWVSDGGGLSEFRRKGDEAIKADPSQGLAAWQEYLAGMEALAAKYPEEDRISLAASDLARVRSCEPAQERSLLQPFAGSPNRSIREKAARWLLPLGQPLEIVFTAMDGRAVDLKNLRGKVVLADF